MDLRYYASGDEPGPLHDGIRQYRGGGGYGLVGEGRARNRPVTEKKAVRERITPPQVLVM
jgi:hypothetical protein